MWWSPEKDIGMNVIIKTAALSKQADGYLIKKPGETTNAHTIVSAERAANVLKLTGETSIKALKELIKGSDFTSISTNELARIGTALGELGLIDEHVACLFISGDMATDKNGHQTKRDVKYNAIAMFNEMLDDNRAYAKNPMYANQESFKIVTRALVSVNQAINALSFFAYSSRDDLSVSVQA